MGYRIDYGPVRKIRGAEKRRVGAAALTGISFLLFLLLVNSCWPRGSQVLRGLVFSGNAAVTAAALEDFSVELQMGEELPSAIENFCRKVIQESDFAAD